MRTFPSRFCLAGVVLIALAIAPSLRAADARVSPIRLDVGAKVPSATVFTSEGAPRDLQALTMEQPTVLIFYRGGWCPFCNAHLGELSTIVDELQAAGFQLLAISPDQPAKLHDAPKRKTRPEFTLLSDQDAAAIDAFGISFVVPDELVAKYKSAYKIDLEADSGRTHHKLPHPAVYIATAGVIRFAYVNEDYKKRLEPEKILVAAKQAATPAM